MDNLVDYRDLALLFIARSLGDEVHEAKLTQLLPSKGVISTILCDLEAVLDLDRAKSRPPSQRQDVYNLKSLVLRRAKGE